MRPFTSSPLRFAPPSPAVLTALAALAVPLAACGGSSSSSSSDASIVLPGKDGGGGTNDAAREAAVDAAKSDAGADAADNGAVSTTYPAFTVDMPQIIANQGKILKAPVFVTVTWPAEDTNVAIWEGIDDGIGASSFWQATTAEYGVGAATGGAANHVHMVTSLPTSISFTDLDTYVLTALTAATAADAGAPDAGSTDAAASDAASADAGDAAIPAKDPTWPAPVMLNGDAQTVYSLFIPASISVTDPGSGMPFCTEGGLGYHQSVTLPNGASVAYSVTLECTSQTLDQLEETATHELVEAATNPYTNATSIGYLDFDANHLAWNLYDGFDELADACQNWADSYYQEGSSFPYWVQRSWTNAGAAAGHDPCAPSATGPYTGLTLFPAQQSMLSVDLTQLGSGKTTARAFQAKVGQSVTFQVGFYSDAASPPWTISYDFPSAPLFDVNFNPVKNGTATVTIDKMSGQNGEKANVTVTPTAAGQLGFQLMAITWDPPAGAQAYLPHFQPVILVNQ